MRPSAPPVPRLVALCSLLFLSACAERAVVGPGDSAPPPDRAVAVLDCTADVRAGAVRCRESGGRSGGARGDLLVGGQGIYVRLASSGTSYDGSAVFRTDVTVQNLLGQPIGTEDGTSADPDGIKVFFLAGPTGVGGTVTVANHDGTGTFTATGQRFFRYVEVLSTEETSAPHEWRFNVPGSVSSFTFQVGVSAPVPDEGALAAIDRDPRRLGTGGYHTCALADTGDGYCWGDNSDGQLGTGVLGPDSVPVPIGGGHNWRDLTGGLFHSCGITTENVAYCWGDNQTGQLGTGEEDDADVPLPTSGGGEWAQIDAGDAHTCAVTTAGMAYCWGAGAAGQLGGGATLPEARTPTVVQTPWRFVSVDAGTDHSCGVTRGGAAYCWGDDTQGELGNGPGGATALIPVLVAGDHSWRSISAGHNFTCGVTSLGVAMCWGSDSAGQLGNGAAAASDVPAAVSGGLEWRRIAAGRETACGVTAAGAGYCWGFNNTGEIGDGTTTLSDVPVAVNGGFEWAWIVGGDYHTCGIRASGEARCWGYNLLGQLGDDTTDNNPFPQVVAGGHTWAQ